MLVVEDLDNHVTASEAATELGCTVTAIQNWVRRGYLKPAGIDIRDGRERDVYKLIDVLRVVRDTRSRALGGLTKIA